MKTAHKRYDITDKTWELIAPYLPGQTGQWGGVAKDNRLFVSAVFWVLRAGAPWRDLPPCYGKWNTVHRRFCRWRDKGVWVRLLELLIDEPGFEWLLIDSGKAKMHLDATGAKNSNQDTIRTKKGLPPKYIWPWLRMVCPSEYLSQRVPQRIVDILLR